MRRSSGGLLAALLLLLATLLASCVSAQNTTTNSTTLGEPFMGLPTDLGVRFLVCPKSTWKTLLTFDNKVHNVTDMESWNKSDFWHYVGHEAVPRSAASFVFLAIAAVALLAYLLWRIVRASILMCCLRKAYTPTEETRGVLKSRTMLGLRVVAIVLMLGVLGAAIAGLILSKPYGGDLMDKAWASFTTVRDYVATLCASLYTVEGTLVNISGTANDVVARLEEANQSSLATSFTSVGNELNSTAGTMRLAIDNLYVLVDKYDVVYEDDYDVVVKYWNGFVLALQIIFGLTMGFVVVLVIAMWLNWGWGIGIFVVLCLICCILFFLLGAAIGVLLVMISDVCPSAEGIIVSVAPTAEAKALVRYYVNEQSDALVVDSLLSTSGLFNLTDVTVTLPGVLRNASDTLEVSGLPANVLTEVRGMLDTINASVTALLRSATAAMAHLSLPGLQTLYSSSKTYVCCTLPSTAAALWSVSTAIGWLLLGVIGMAFGAQALLDKSNTQGRCCACVCVRSGGGPDIERAVDEEKLATTARSDGKAVVAVVVDSKPMKYSGAHKVPPLSAQATYGDPPDMEKGGRLST